MQGDFDVEEVPAEEVLDRQLDRMMLKQELSRLTAHQQQTIEHLAQGASIQEVAKLLDCTARAVYNRKYAAIHRLRQVGQQAYAV